jgi:uncharacterized protein YutE (UPF0331/DUF86 family)
MDKPLITEKLEALRHCVRRIHEKCPPEASLLADDTDLQDILAMNLTRAVQICVDIAAHIVAESDLPAPHSMGDAFEALVKLKVLDEPTAINMKRAVGLRNIAVHAYDRIDWDIVHLVCRERLDDFLGFMDAIVRRLD